MDKLTPILMVAFACAAAGLGVWRKDLSPMEGLALVGSTVTAAAAVHAHGHHKRKKKHAAAKDAANKNGANP